MSALRSIVDVRPGEGRPLARLAGLLGLIIAGHTMLETVRDSLFLLELPIGRLAMVYGLMAALALLTVPASGRLARRLGRRDALGISLAVSAVGTTVFALCPPGPAMAIALYLWTGLVGTIVSAQFWMLAGQTFDLAQGKRLFGPLAAAGALGAFVGALVATQVVTWLPVTALLPVVALVQAVAGLLARGGGGDDARAAAALAPTALTATGATATVQRQGYLRRIALLVALSSAGLLAVDFLFKGTITLHVAPSHLPVFLARFHAAVAGLSFVLQIVGAGWLVRRSGVVVALCVLPALLLGGAVAAIGAPLVGVVLARAADGVLRHSLHRVAAELLWAPVPAAVRDAVRASVDGVVMRVAQAVTAAALVGLSALGIDRPPLLAAVVAVVIAAWLAVAIAIRRAYLDQFRLAVARPTFGGQADPHLDLDAAEVLTEALASPEPRRVAAAIAVLHAHDRARLVPALVLHHPAPQVVVAALAAIAVPARRDWQALTQQLLGHDDAAVRLAALRALARADRLELVHGASGLRLDPTLRGHTAFWAAATAPGAAPAAIGSVRALLDERGASGTAARAALLDAIGADGDGRWSEVIATIIARDPGACAGALRAIERVGDPRFIPQLIARLGVRRDRAAIRAGLVQLGDDALDALEAAFDDAATPVQVRIHLPTTIAQFDGPRPAAILLDHLDERGPAGFRVVRALAHIACRRRVAIADARVVAALRRNLGEHVRTGALGDIIATGPATSTGELLQALLRDKQAQALDRVFLLLQTVHPHEDLAAMQDALHHGDRAGRAGARELLAEVARRTGGGGVPPADVRALLALLADDLDAGEHHARAFTIVEPLPDDVEAALAELALDDDVAAAELARAHRARLVADRLAALPRAAELVSLPPPPRPHQEARRVRRS